MGASISGGSRPGAILGRDADPAFGPISIIDHANLHQGATVHMHEHKDDEIQRYLWRGTMVHEDSTGDRVEISSRRLMMMNAGVGFRHEESTPGGPVEMLQIFVRPSEADLPARVRFHERPDAPDDAWRLVAGPDDMQAPLRIRQRVIVYDAVISAGREVLVPEVAGMTPWLYVMDGAVTLGSERLGKGDAATDADAPLPLVRLEAPSTLNAFLVDLKAAASGAGTISAR